MAIQHQLRGTGVALVTPFTKEGIVDFTALGKVIDHVIKGGIDYLVTLGTTGETPTLSKEEKIAIIEFTFSKSVFFNNFFNGLFFTVCIRSELSEQ